MKKLFLFLLLVGLISAILFYAHKDPGYIMVSYQHWVVATSLWAAVATLLILFLVLHYFLKTIHFFSELPARFRQRKTLSNSKKFQLLLSQGVICRLLGNHKKAEKFFAKAAKLADDPASMYLLAAQSANVLNEIERREKYLEAVVNQKPEYQEAVLQIRAK